MPPLRIIFAGAGEFGLPTLRALLRLDPTRPKSTPGQSVPSDSEKSAAPDPIQLQLLHIYTQPDRPAGRGRKLAPTPIGQFALDHNLPLTRTQDINHEPLPPADLLIVIAFGQKISEAVARHARLGSVNLHSSRLPKFRGAAPINWAILNGETHTGNSIIRLAQKMDAGAILAMSDLPIGELETAGELHDRLAEDGAPLLLQTIEQLATNSATVTAQDESQATKAIKLNRESSKIDWNTPAEIIARQIRGMYPWPGCRVRLLTAENQESARLTLVRARAPKTGMGGPPMNPNDGGTITPNGFIITATELLEVIEVQPEGKRPMPLTAYRNGHPWNANMRCESIS
jgi:methionyl-tRNA formyltransferase